MNGHFISALLKGRIAVVFGGPAIAAALFMQPVDVIAQRATPAPPAAEPADNLLIIVADIQRHVNDDVYKYPVATDVLGQNLYRASLVRLANYEALYPKSNADIVAMAKGQCLEKLCSYAEAAANFEKAAKSEDKALVKVAEESLERVRAFDEIMSKPIDRSAMRTYERDLKAQIEGLKGLAQRYRGKPAEALARVEQERTEMTLAAFYAAVRFVQPFTTEQALKQIKENIETHKASKNAYSHRLMLGDIYYTLAQEYVVASDPDSAGFNLKTFEGYANSARAEYYVVQQADGFAEKLEGRAKLAALEAFVERVRERGR